MVERRGQGVVLGPVVQQLAVGDAAVAGRQNAGPVGEPGACREARLDDILGQIPRGIKLAPERDQRGERAADRPAGGEDAVRISAIFSDVAVPGPRTGVR